VSLVCRSISLTRRNPTKASPRCQGSTSDNWTSNRTQSANEVANYMLSGNYPSLGKVRMVRRNIQQFLTGRRCELDRPSMLREIDRIPVGIMNPVFGLTVWRSLVDAGLGVEFFACLSQAGDILHLETKMV
jgi:hypothetical protein